MFPVLLFSSPSPSRNTCPLLLASPSGSCMSVYHRFIIFVCHWQDESMLATFINIMNGGARRQLRDHVVPTLFYKWGTCVSHPRPGGWSVSSLRGTRVSPFDLAQCFSACFPFLPAQLSIPLPHPGFEQILINWDFSQPYWEEIFLWTLRSDYQGLQQECKVSPQEPWCRLAAQLLVHKACGEREENGSLSSMCMFSGLVLTIFFSASNSKLAVVLRKCFQDWILHLCWTLSGSKINFSVQRTTKQSPTVSLAWLASCKCLCSA